MLRSLGIAVFALLLVFPVSAQNPAPAFVPGDCPFEPPDNVNAECGTVTLPENRAIPDGNQVQIAVAVFRAVGDDPLPDPLFYLAGGPGGYTLETWGPYFNYDFAPFNQNRDIVLFDYRGAGESHPNLFCNEVYVYNLSTLGTRREDSLEEYYAALTACHQRLTEDENINLHMYRSAILAQDVVDLREALGYEEINLLGASYGSRLALTLLRDHPENIRSVILDGVYPPQVNRSAENLLNANRALEALFEGCASTPTCHEAFPDLRANFYAAANQLNDKPATVSVPIGLTDDTYEVVVDGTTFVEGVINALYSTWVIPSLPLIIQQVAGGNYQQFSYLLSDSNLTGSRFSLGLYVAQECSDEAPFNDLDDTINAAANVPELAAIFTTNGFAAERAYFENCVLWGVKSPDAIENQAVHSELPVLIFNGQFDPVTPPGWGELAAQTLPNSTVITFPGVGHGVSHSGSVCAQEIAIAFLSDPTARLDTACADDTTLYWITTDLSTTHADIQAMLDRDTGWVLDDHQTSGTWNYATWRFQGTGGLLRITDYTTPLSEAMDEAWFEVLFSNWDDYELMRECAVSDIQLFEFSAEAGAFSRYMVHYWVDRRRPELNREVFLAFPEENSTAFDRYSELLYSELPGCTD